MCAYTRLDGNYGTTSYLLFCPDLKATCPGEADLWSQLHGDGESERRLGSDCYVQAMPHGHCPDQVGVRFPGEKQKDRTRLCQGHDSTGILPNEMWMTKRVTLFCTWFSFYSGFQNGNSDCRAKGGGSGQ